MTQIVKFPDQVWARLATIAEKQDVTIADLIVAAVNTLSGTAPIVHDAPRQPATAGDVLAVLDQIQELHELNRSGPEIAAATGMSAASVAQVLARLGLLPLKQPRTHAIDVAEFQRLYDAGCSDREIAVALHVSPPTVGRERRALGLPVIGQPGRPKQNTTEQETAA